MPGRCVMKYSGILASLGAIMLLVSGTYAAQAFNQLAFREVMISESSPGARLHDYFNGSDKNVFIENYGTEEDAEEVYARIRLSEYMEYGYGAGTGTTNNITKVRGDILRAWPLIDESDTWDVYDYAATVNGTSGEIRDYRALELGGLGVYMPTFNKDNTDQTPEFKGTYRDSYGIIKDNPYDDYKSYAVGDTEYKRVVTADGESDYETMHTAKDTASATIMTMERWKNLELEEKIGDYWVFDTTGWAYYAKPIPADYATGFLLDGIEVVSNPKEQWYYAIDVSSQICTAGDWGEEADAEDGTDATGMYGDMTDDSKELLDLISNGQYLSKDIELTIDGVEFYELARETVEEYSADGEYLGTREAALIWSKDTVTLPSDVYYNFGYPTYAYFHNRSTGDSTWTDSYMRTDVLPAWLGTMPTLSESAIVVKNTTSGYFRDDSQEPTVHTNEEITYDKAFLLSQPEFVNYVGLHDDKSSLGSLYWLRSAYTGKEVRLVYTGGTMFSYYYSAAAFGVRPAVWICL